ncbi:MAG: TPM domain-containing protein [Paracoccaceae bacterium]
MRFFYVVPLLFLPVGATAVPVFDGASPLLDQADVISSSDEAEVAQDLSAAAQTAGQTLLIFFVEDAEGQAQNLALEQFAAEVLANWQDTQGEDLPTYLLAIDPSAMLVRLVATSDVSEDRRLVLLTALQDAMDADLSKGDYASAVRAGADAFTAFAKAPT